MKRSTSIAALALAGVFLLTPAAQAAPDPLDLFDSANWADSATHNWCTSANMELEINNGAVAATKVAKTLPLMLSAIDRESDIVAGARVFGGTCVGSATDVQVDMVNSIVYSDGKKANADTLCMKHASGRCSYYRIRVVRSYATGATDMTLRAALCHELLHSLGIKHYGEAGFPATNSAGAPASQWTCMRVPEIDQIGSYDTTVLNAKY